MWLIFMQMKSDVNGPDTLAKLWDLHDMLTDVLLFPYTDISFSSNFCIWNPSLLFFNLGQEQR
jgi:hypothetical protein